MQDIMKKIFLPKLFFRKKPNNMALLFCAVVSIFKLVASLRIYQSLLTVDEYSIDSVCICITCYGCGVNRLMS